MEILSARRAYRWQWLASCSALMLAFACASCGTLPAGHIAKLAKQNNYVPYIPAQGDPRNQSSWDRRGPGAILRNAAYQAEYFASDVVGMDEVKQITTAAQDPQSRIPFAALSNKRAAGWEFDGQGGWAFSGAADVTGKLGLSSVTTVDVKLGNVWVAEPFSYGSLRDRLESRRVRLHERTLRNLRRGTSFMVLKTIYADSIQIYFKTAKAGGGEVAVKIPATEAQKLGGKYSITTDGAVEVTTPVIIGYVPVLVSDLDQILPARR